MVYALEGLHNSPLYRQAAQAAEVRWVTTRKGDRIPLVWLRREALSKVGPAVPSRPSVQSEAPLVLLHCHGNATDIGMMMGPYYELAKVLGIEVVGVEYSGYGPSGDGAAGDKVSRPSSGKTLADVEAAYDYLVSCGVSPERIVAYGQSVGSGPVSGLSSKRKLGGLILHSPLLSGIKVVDPQPDKCCRPSCVYKCFDFYPNDRCMRQATCPVFVMHGQRDEVVPFYHGSRLHQECPKEQRWPAYFPARANHNDIVETDMRAYFGEVSNFLHDVKRRAAGLPGGPPMTDKPGQVEMSQAMPQVKARPSGGAVRLSKDMAKESQGENEDLQPALLASDKLDAQGPDGLESNLDAQGAQPRMQAGPDDGRYDQMRGGNIAASLFAGARTDARDVKVVDPSASGEGTPGDREHL